MPPEATEKDKIKWIHEGTTWEQGMKMLENIWVLGTLVRLLSKRTITLDSYEDTRKELEV